MTKQRALEDNPIQRHLPNSQLHFLASAGKIRQLSIWMCEPPRATQKSCIKHTTEQLKDRATRGFSDDNYGFMSEFIKHLPADPLNIHMEPCSHIPDGCA